MRRRRLAIALGLVLLLAAACRRRPAAYHLDAPDPATLRHPPAGDIVGGAGRWGAFAWLGIPYARSPVGDRRWRAPEPGARWSGTREALAFGAPCVQYGSPFGGVPGVARGEVGGDEDCLTLNVWAPRTGTRHPVLVWIHGGGNSIGHAGTYDGGHLAVSQDLVVVTVQYRLGPFGWFRYRALRAGARDDAERSGDFGTLDLLRALAWVRDNVAAFGGDPDDVTIAGESAGGPNVYSLLASPLARGLFHRAVVESGVLRTASPAEAERDGVQSSSEIVLRLLEGERFARSRAEAARHLAGLDDAAVAARLRALPAAAVLRAYDPGPTGMIDMPRLVRDGTVIPADGLLAALGRPDGWNRVPVLVGTNRDENKLFMFPDPRWVRRILWIVPRLRDRPLYLATADYLARMWKAMGADGPATAMARAEPRVFVYRFDWREEPTILGADLGEMLGAAHAFEIPFVFGHFELGPESGRLFTADNAAGREALSGRMMDFWGAFARTGSPGGVWEPWADGRTLVLDTEAGGGVRMVSGTETRARVLAALGADPRLAAPRARCRALRALADFGFGYTRADYARDCGPGASRGEARVRRRRTSGPGPGLRTWAGASRRRR
jgi:para-nitrobenzyl esterase